MSSSLSRRQRRRNRHGLSSRSSSRLSIDIPAAFEGSIIHRAHVPAMMTAAMSGDVGAATLVRAINQWLADAGRTKLGKGPLCLDCNVEFGPGTGEVPIAFAVLTPFAAEKGHLVVTGICRACSAKEKQHDEGLLAVAKSCWLAFLGPGMQVAACSSAAH